MSARNMIGRASLPREGSAEVTVANVGLRPGLSLLVLLLLADQTFEELINALILPASSTVLGL
jgi:hypothetical protein